MRKLLPVRAEDARREPPVGALRGEVAEYVVAHGYRAHVVRAQPEHDHHAHRDEPGQRDGQGRQRPAQQGAGRDAQRHREQRVAHRDEAHDVEPAGVELIELLGVGRAGPPGHQGRDDAAPDRRGQQHPADLDREPALAGDALHPGELGGAGLGLGGHQRGAPEQADQQRRAQRGDDQEAHHAAAHEQPAQLSAALARGAACLGGMELMRHLLAGDHDHDGERGQQRGADEVLDAVLAPDKPGHWSSPTVVGWVGLGVAADQCDRGDRDEGGGQDEEDAGLDALERPVAVGGLVGQEPAEVGQDLRAGCRGSERTPALRGTPSREVGGGDAVEHAPVRVLVDGLAVRAEDARRDLPEGPRRREAAGHLVVHGDRAQVVRAQPQCDHRAHRDEAGQGDGDGRQRPAQQRAGRDAERHREQRVGHRDGAHDVEPAGVERIELLGVVRPGPPGHQGRDDAAPDRRGQQHPADLDREPALAGDALHPGELGGARLGLGGHQRGAQEQPDQDRRAQRRDDQEADRRGCP